MNEIAMKDKVQDRRTAVNLTCNLGAHGLCALIAFFLTPYLVRTLGLATYGFYPVAIELMGFFSLFSGLLNATATRYISIEMARGNKGEAQTYFSTVFFASVLLSVLLLLPMAAVVVFCDRFLDIPAAQVGSVRIFFLLMLASALVDTVFSVFSAAYSVSGRLDFRAGQQLAGALVKAGLLWLLLSVFRPNIVGIGVAVFGSSFAVGILQMAMSGYLMRDIVVSFKDISFSHLRRVVASGFWYSVWRLGVFLVTGAFLFAVNILYGAAAGGTYSVALTVSRVFSGVLLVLSGVYVPVMEKKFAEDDREALCASVTTGQKTVGFFALVGAAMCIGFCREFFSLWLGDANSAELRLLTVMLTVPALAAATALPLVNLTLVVNKMRRLSLLFLGGTLLSLAVAISLRVFLKCDILAAGAVSALAQTVWYAMLMPLFAARFLRRSPLDFYMPVLRTYFGCALSVGLLCVVKSAFAVDSWLKLGVMFALCLGAVAFIGYLSVRKT